MDRLVPPLPAKLEVDDSVMPIMMMVMLDPRGKGRPRADRGRVHTDEKTAAWSDSFKWMTITLRQRRIKDIEYIWGKPIAVALECYFKMPQKPEFFCTSSVDNDNAEKMVWDACQGIFFKNDNRIIANCTFKDWAEQDPPHVRVRIYPLRKKTNNV